VVAWPRWVRHASAARLVEVGPTRGLGEWWPWSGSGRAWVLTARRIARLGLALGCPRRGLEARRRRAREAGGRRRLGPFCQLRSVFMSSSLDGVEVEVKLFLHDGPSWRTWVCAISISERGRHGLGGRRSHQEAALASLLLLLIPLVGPAFRSRYISRTVRPKLDPPQQNTLDLHSAPPFEPQDLPRVSSVTATPSLVSVPRRVRPAC
jgi:hypothetical protein